MTEQIKKQTTNQTKKHSSSVNPKPKKPFRSRKRSNSSQKNLKTKNFYSDRIEEDNDTNRFYCLYGIGDLRKDKEILAVSKETFSQKSTVIESAKRKLREQICSRGGNAVFNLNVERGDTYRGCWGEYSAAIFTASGQAALVVSKALDESQKNKLKVEFEDKFNPKTTQLEAEEQYAPIPVGVTVLAICAILAFCAWCALN